MEPAQLSLGVVTWLQRKTFARVVWSNARVLLADVSHPGEVKVLTLKKDKGNLLFFPLLKATSAHLARLEHQPLFTVAWLPSWIQNCLCSAPSLALGSFFFGPRSTHNYCNHNAEIVQCEQNFVKNHKDTFLFKLLPM